MSGHADLLLGYVTTRDAERAEALRDWRRYAGADPRPVRDLARAPLAAHARAAARARLRQRAGDRRAARGPRRRGGRALPGAAERPRPRDRAAPDEAATARSSRSTSARRERAERFLGGRRARHRRHQLRQRAHHAPSGAPAGAATPCPRASSGSARGLRGRPPICSADVEHGRSTSVVGSKADGGLGLVDDRRRGARRGRDLHDGLLPRPDRGRGRPGGGRGRSRAPGSRVQWVVFIAASVGVARSCCGRSRGATCARRRGSAPARPRWWAGRPRCSSAWTRDGGRVKIGGEVWSARALRRGRVVRAGRPRRGHEDRRRHGARRRMRGMELLWPR